MNWTSSHKGQHVMRLAPLGTVVAVLTVVTQWGDSSCSPFVGCWGEGGGGGVQVTHLEIDGRAQWLVK